MTSSSRPGADRPASAPGTPGGSDVPEPRTAGGLASRLRGALGRGDVTARWDLLVRSTGVAALIGIPVVLFVPGSVPLVWLVLVGLPANGPLSPVLPTVFEPMLMEAARYQAVVPVALAALSVALYTEYLNWHLYAWVLSWERFAALRERRSVRRAVAGFARWPFGTVVTFAFTPLPFWVVRCVAILEGYDVRRFLFAGALGRLPRYLLYAWAGAALKVPSVWLLAVAVGTAVLVIAWRLGRGVPVLADTVLAPPPVEAPPASRRPTGGARGTQASSTAAG